MRKSESWQSHENRAQSADSSNACSKPTAFKNCSTISTKIYFAVCCGFVKIFNQLK